MTTTAALPSVKKPNCNKESPLKGFCHGHLALTVTFCGSWYLQRTVSLSLCNTTHQEMFSDLSHSESLLATIFLYRKNTISVIIYRLQILSYKVHFAHTINYYLFLSPCRLLGDLWYLSHLCTCCISEVLIFFGL
ncbi:Hypothetical predicted protein [Podarcis lilfordi]|uniref:Uncharacterized protein n=1 Tax=Podarcis lilfordi TaxID=74358 RepID=A0AA35PAI5_9SAUR|nr:Hypothetical predicted protein [Podarcis lilfordi]